jgi:hypothetical protein
VCEAGTKRTHPGRQHRATGLLSFEDELKEAEGSVPTMAAPSMAASTAKRWLPSEVALFPPPRLWSLPQRCIGASRADPRVGRRGGGGRERLTGAGDHRGDTTTGR